MSFRRNYTDKPPNRVAMIIPGKYLPEIIRMRSVSNSISKFISESHARYPVPPRINLLK